jgi:hypothetical protein
LQMFLLGVPIVIARSEAAPQSIVPMPRDGCFPPSPQVLRRTRRFVRKYGSLFGRTASNRPNLFHSATAMRSRLKIWNESGTKRARIGDSYRNPIRSPQHLALAASRWH